MSQNKHTNPEGKTKKVDDGVGWGGRERETKKEKELLEGADERGWKKDNRHKMLIYTVWELQGVLFQVPSFRELSLFSLTILLLSQHTPSKKAN